MSRKNSNRICRWNFLIAFLIVLDVIIGKIFVRNKWNTMNVSVKKKKKRFKVHQLLLSVYRWETVQASLKGISLREREFRWQEFRGISERIFFGVKSSIGQRSLVISVRSHVKRNYLYPRWTDTRTEKNKENCKWSSIISRR